MFVICQEQERPRACLALGERRGLLSSHWAHEPPKPTAQLGATHHKSNPAFENDVLRGSGELISTFSRQF